MEQQPASSSSSSSQQAPWLCPICTMVNSSVLTLCSCCGVANPDAQARHAARSAKEAPATGASAAAAAAATIASTAVITDSLAAIPTRRCPVCAVQVDVHQLDAHVAAHLDGIGAGGQMNWDSPAGSQQGGVDMDATAPPSSATRALLLAHPSGGVHCATCGIILAGAAALAEHERGHARQEARIMAASPAGSTQAGGGASAGGGQSRAADAGAGAPTDEIRLQCPQCKKFLFESELEAHVARHNSRAGGGTPMASPASSAAAASGAEAAEEPRKACSKCGKMVRECIFDWHESGCGVTRQVECVSCMDSLAMEDAFSLSCCNHSFYCRECFDELLDFSLNNARVAACPVRECRKPVTSQDVLGFFRMNRDDDKFKRYAEIELALTLGQDCYMTCPTDGCPNRVLVDDSARRVPTCFRCSSCNNSSCTLCRASPFHYRLTCNEARATRAMWLGILLEISDAGGASRVNDARDAVRAYEELRADEQYKASNGYTCPNCSRVLFHDGGCNDMMCFDGATPVAMADGSEKRIDQVRAGDVVLCRNMRVAGGAAASSGKAEDEQEVVACPVFAHLDQGVKDVVQLTFADNRVVTCTPDHRFCTTEGEWVEAQDIPLAGDAEQQNKCSAGGIVQLAGDSRTVCDEGLALVRREPLDAPRPVYDISIDTKSDLCRNFFANGVSAHNCGRDYHGGNVQDGCGHRFDIREAGRYQPQLPAPPNQARVRQELLSTREHSEFDRCTICHQQIRGPRFLDCNEAAEMSFCLACVPRACEDPQRRDHFFSVIG